MSTDQGRPGRVEMAPQVSSGAWGVLIEAPRRAARRFSRELTRPTLGDEAATLAFWFLLSFFPLLLSLFAVFGWIIGSRVEIRESLVSWLDKIVPDAYATSQINRVLDEVQGGPDEKLVIGVLMALWAGSNALNEVQRAVDRDEDRQVEGGVLRMLRRRLAALPLTLVVALPVVAAMALHFYGGLIGRALSTQLDLDSVFEAVWPWVRWPALVVALLTSFDLAYNTSPSQWSSRNHWLSPGAVLALGLWIVASEGLRLYVAEALRYSPFYGVLGGLIVLVFWFYLSAGAVLVGIRLNQVLDGMRQEEG